jgi:hypothetical protein
MQLEPLESIEAPSRQFVRVRCECEQPEIVNNQRKSVWQFRCTYTHSVWDGQAGHRSCPNSWCCNVLPSKPCRLQATQDVLKNGGSGGFGGAFRASVHCYKRRGETRHQFRRAGKTRGLQSFRRRSLLPSPPAVPRPPRCHGTRGSAIAPYPQPYST